MRNSKPQTASSLLAIAVALGGLAIPAVPLLCLWAATQVHGTAGLALAMFGCPGALVLWGAGLSRLNRRYLRASSHPAAVLETSVTAAVALAVLVTLVWMLFLGSGGPDVPLRVI